jgi:hypothetical protein
VSTPMKGAVRLAPVAIDAALIAILLALGLALCVLTTPDYLAVAAGGDFPFYVQMAASPLANAAAPPWNLRILNPALASALIAAGVPVSLAFLTLTWLFALVSSTLMGIFLRQLMVSPLASRAGALLFAASAGGCALLRRNFGYPDALTNCGILAVLICVAAKRRGLLAWALTAAAFTKETVLLMLPWCAWQARHWRPRLAVIALIALPIGVWLMLRIALSSADAPVAFTIGDQLAYWREAMTHGALRWILWSVVYSLGPIWLVALIAAPRNIAFIARFALFLAAVFVPLARTTDTDRALMLTFPVVIPLAACALDNCGARHRVLIASAITIACTLITQMSFAWSPAARIGPLNAKDLLVATVCLLSAGVVMFYQQAAERGDRATLHWPLKATSPERT